MELEKVSKEFVYNTMRELLFSFNYVWFKFEEWIKQKHPEEFKSEEFKRMYKEFGAYEARRLIKVLNISKGNLDELIVALQHSHWCIFENVELTKISENKFRMRTLNCSAQKAAKKWGKGHYDCRWVGLLLRTGFLKAINPKVNVQRIFTPPEKKPNNIPKDVSCEWIISI